MIRPLLISLVTIAMCYFLERTGKEFAPQREGVKIIRYSKAFRVVSVVSIIASVALTFLIIDLEIKKSHSFDQCVPQSSIVLLSLVAAVYLLYEVFLKKFAYDDEFLYCCAPLIGSHVVSWDLIEEIGYSYFMQSRFILFHSNGKKVKIFFSSRHDGYQELERFISLKIANIRAKQLLKYVLDECEFSGSIKGNWLWPHDRLPAIRALWCRQENALEISVLTEEQLLIVSRFFCLSLVQEYALVEGIRNFAGSALYALLGGFWSRLGIPTLSVETWNIAGHDFAVYFSQPGIGSTEEHPVSLPERFVEEVHTLIKQQSLTPEIHWLQVIALNNEQGLRLEARLDDQLWPPGLACLQEMPWEKCDNVYSISYFVLLKPTA